MTNPFDSKTPAKLLALVQDGVPCKACGGNGGHAWMETIAGGMDEHGEPVPIVQRVEQECAACNGSGRVSLCDADLDALAACVCEGEWVRWCESGRPPRWQKIYAIGQPHVWIDIPTYTTSPDAAMRLAVKYGVGIVYLSTGRAAFTARVGPSLYAEEGTVEARCHGLATAALIAALTEAMEGASSPGG